MWNKILAIVTILIALIIAICAFTLQGDAMRGIIVSSRFFEVMIPILAVGAIVRYLTYCPHMKIWNTVLSACFLFLALLVAVLSVVLSEQDINIVIILVRFFDVMLPIVGVGALVKYLTHCHKAECK